MSELAVQEIKDHLGDREWRLNNLYFVKDKRGDKVLFRLNDVQKELHDNLWFFNIVPKARQLGITTFFAILYLDQVLFSENQTAGIIAHKEKDMKKIFKDKIRFAWNNLHPWLKVKIGEPSSDSAYELTFPNGSSVFVSMSTRSGTVQFLHISEFGYICSKTPEKAEEIVTGAINSVHIGQMVSIESTAAGQEGHFYRFCMDALKNQQEGRELTPLDFKLFFFPWWQDPEYTLESSFLIEKQHEDYFRLLEEQSGINLTDGQKRWYIKKKAQMGDNMFAEYPSTLEEAFRVSSEGAYFQKQMGQMYTDRRIRTCPYDPNLPVDTWWDLGMNDFNVCLLTQTKGQSIHFIDMYWNHSEGLAHYVSWLEDQRSRYSYRFGTHHFPHDIEVRELSTGESRKNALIKLGLRNIRVGKKVEVAMGIENIRKIFTRFVIDEGRCRKLHESLFNYRREWDDKMGVFKDKPRHDEASHFVDPVRLLANEWQEPVIYSEEESKVLDQSFFS